MYVSECLSICVCISFVYIYLDVCVPCLYYVCMNKCVRLCLYVYLTLPFCKTSKSNLGILFSPQFVQVSSRSNAPINESGVVVVRTPKNQRVNRPPSEFYNKPPVQHTHAQRTACYIIQLQRVTRHKTDFVE